MDSLFTDGSDDLNNEGGYEIKIHHVPTGKNVKFKAWVTSFSDSYQSNWNTEDVYGRMDPISTFQNTRRTISLSWDVVAASEAEAKTNMSKCEKLFRMLYPSYESGPDNASNIRQAPLFKIKFGNLISGVGGGAAASAGTSGLLGTLGGFEYAPDFESGFFTPGKATMYPQMISLNAEFQVLHNFPLGWKADKGKKKEFRTENFPYGKKSVASDLTETPDETSDIDYSGATPKDLAAGYSHPRDDGEGEGDVYEEPQGSGMEPPYMTPARSTEGNQSTQPQKENVTEEQEDAMMSPAQCDPGTSC